MGKYRIGKKIIITIPKELILILKDEFNIKNFIETGAYQAETTLWAVKNDFEQIYTCEPSSFLFNICLEKLRKYKKKCHLYNTDSETMLNEIIIPNLKNDNNIFWLDSHFNQDNRTYGEDKPCPLLKELEIISSLSGDQYIIIDDFRMFAFPRVQDKIFAWPSLDEIFSTLSLFSDNFTFIIPDCIISFPIKCKQLICDLEPDIIKF